MFGNLMWLGAGTRPDLLAPAVFDALTGLNAKPEELLVAEIDPDVADTAAFCERYSVPMRVSANCVVIAARRSGETRFAACVVLATTRVDVNNVVRRHLGARKASFAPMAEAVAATGMEYGGITPIGLPAGWALLVDTRVVEAGPVVVGSGVRRSKLVVPGASLVALPEAEVLDGLGLPVDPSG